MYMDVHILHIKHDGRAGEEGPPRLSFGTHTHTQAPIGALINKYSNNRRGRERVWDPNVHTRRTL